MHSQDLKGLRQDVTVFTLRILNINASFPLHCSLSINPFLNCSQKQNSSLHFLKNMALPLVTAISWNLKSRFSLYTFMILYAHLSECITSIFSPLWHNHTSPLELNTTKFGISIKSHPSPLYSHQQLHMRCLSRAQDIGVLKLSFETQKFWVIRKSLVQHGWMDVSFHLPLLKEFLIEIMEDFHCHIVIYRYLDGIWRAPNLETSDVVPCFSTSRHHNSSWSRRHWWSTAWQKSCDHWALERK